MNSLRQFAFRQYLKVHIFCLLMMVIFRIFMTIQMGFMLWIVLLSSTFGSIVYLVTKPFMLSKDTYTVMAVTSCISLSIIAQRFLWIAFRIDWRNMLFFFLSMLLFASLIAVWFRKKGWYRRKNQTMREKIGRLRYTGWSFFFFLFFYQLILSYLLRPNFLTVLALTVSHMNVLLMMWTYFDVRRLYVSK